jgi:threonylcarbamoyladenosine tRNA methylthiotransferase MtaB
MATFHILNFGCRATQADGAAIARQLVERGCARAEAAAGADFVVVNTCTVTASADSQARQAIRQIRRENPAARIVVTGCYAQRAPEELATLDGVAWVVGNSHKPEIPNLVGQASRPVHKNGLAQLQGAQPRLAAPHAAQILTGDIFAVDTVLVAPVFAGEGDLSAADAIPQGGTGRTRPILKIQDGCNYRCSYCVIPFVRGRSRSLAPAQVLEEIRRLTAAGYKEVVLSGISLGSYGRDLVPRVELANLVRRILDDTRLEQLRLSSVEPMDVTRDLIELVASSNRVARHFHIPLQSGSDRILARMHRWYRTEHYVRRIELIRALLPDAAIGADLIAGFPGETDNDHRATVALVERLPFTYLHVFAFSARPGTPAATMPNRVPAQVIKQRSKELRALAAEKGAASRAAHLGRTFRVLTLQTAGLGGQSFSSDKVAAGEEGASAPEVSTNAWTEAISSNYLKVRLAGSHPANTWLDVRITAVRDNDLVGTPAIAQRHGPRVTCH